MFTGLRRTPGAIAAARGNHPVSGFRRIEPQSAAADERAVSTRRVRPTATEQFPKPYLTEGHCSTYKPSGINGLCAPWGSRLSPPKARVLPPETGQFTGSKLTASHQALGQGAGNPRKAKTLKSPPIAHFSEFSRRAVYA